MNIVFFLFLIYRWKVKSFYGGVQCLTLRIFPFHYYNPSSFLYFSTIFPFLESIFFLLMFLFYFFPSLFIVLLAYRLYILIFSNINNILHVLRFGLCASWINQIFFFLCFGYPSSRAEHGVVVVFLHASPYFIDEKKIRCLATWVYGFRGSLRTAWCIYTRKKDQLRFPPEIQVIVRRDTPCIVECAVRIVMHFARVLEADWARGRQRGGSGWLDD